MRLFRILLPILILSVIPYSQPLASENYNEQIYSITLFYETLNKKEAASVSDFFRLFARGNEAELELILRQQFPYLNWKGNWFGDEEALKYINDAYDHPERYQSRFLQCIKSTEPLFSSRQPNPQIESAPSLTRDFRKFTVISHDKKVIFEFSQDEAYIESI
jgi:hypothetical protein